MPITQPKASLFTGAYSLCRRTGLLKTRLGSAAFRASYFIYKRHLEDPFAALASRHPEVFRGGDILDIGANIGYTATLFAKVCDPDATVFAFEPESFNFALLERSIRARGLQSRVIAIESAVGDSDGEITLWLNEHHHADHRVVNGHVSAASPVPEESRRKVAITSIDTFLRQQPTSRPVRFIKIDVQGYELAVCRGMADTLRREPCACVAIEYMPQAMNDLGFSAPDLLEWFKELGLRMYSIQRDGTLRAGLSDRLECDGYVDLLFSRSAFEDPKQH